MEEGRRLCNEKGYPHETLSGALVGKRGEGCIR